MEEIAVDLMSIQICALIANALKTNVRYENKYTKRSSNTLLRLLYLFS